MRRKTISLGTLGVAAAVVLLAMLRAGAQSPLTVTFTENGPFGLTAPNNGGPNPWAGAISAVVPHPANPDVMWIGAVNGGVWKTTNATHANPTWVPLTDHQASLSIGALASDPADPQVLIAGFGHPSAFNGNGGPLTGLLRTTDGGGHWEAIGETQFAGQGINGIVVNANGIIAASGTGIWRSDYTGATFYHLGSETFPDCGQQRNIVQRSVDALVGDPAEPNVIYATIPGSSDGSSGGVFASVDFGCTWDDISFGGTFGQPFGKNLLATALRIRLAVHDDGRHKAVYAAILNDKKHLSGLFRSDDMGTTWTALDNPHVTGGNGSNLTIRADPTSRWIVYVGGDKRAFSRCNASFPRGIQCAPIAGTGGTIDGSAPHEDSRSLTFDAAGNLLETDDGGLFQRLLPRHVFGFWRSLNGNLSITETHSCAWDHVRHEAICGAQDNGVVAQQTAGAAEWKGLTNADGGNVAVTEGAGFSMRYFSIQHLGKFQRDLCVSLFCLTTTPSLIINNRSGTPHLDSSSDPILVKGQEPYSVPIAAHALNPSRLVIATRTVYESDDAGDTLTALDNFAGTATKAIAFGSASLHDILYVGSERGLFRHTTKFGPMERLDTYTFGTPVVMTLDPEDWQSAWVINASPGTNPVTLSGDSIWHTPTGGVPTGQQTWTDVTGNLEPGGLGATNFHAIAFAPGLVASVIFAGAREGLYAMSTSRPGCWFRLQGTLPNAVVYDLDYDVTDDLLLITTLGRGTWTVGRPGSISLPTGTCGVIVEVPPGALSAR
jgi:hypothetical protein